MNSSTTAVSDLTNAKKSTPPVVREQIIKGVRYVYEDYPYWDKLKKQTRHKRVYKGHYDSEGNFVASKSYQNKDDSNTETKEIALTQVKTGRFIGATYLLDRIALKTGLYNDLKELFPDKYEQILSLAYYTTLENENNFYRFSKWAKTHFHPYNQVISSKRATDLISTISENDKIELFKRQVIRLQENEYLAYDTTSVSSYSENIKQLKYGHNKDGDNLAQINLALVLGENSLLPTYYRIFPGNINDSTTLDKLLIDFKFFKIENATFVFDRGFYNVQNIHRLHHDNFKYIIGVKNNLSYVANRIEELSTKKLDISNFSSKHNVYYYPYDIFMPFKKQHKGFNIDPPHKVKSTLHIYFDPAKAILDTINLNNKIKNAIENYKNDIKSAKITDIINKYCKINYNESNGLFSIDYNKVAIEDDTRKFGYFSLLSNIKIDSEEVLTKYRNKDVIEKSFDNLKNRLNLRRTGIHSFQNLEGQVFIQYIGLCFILYVHKHMKEHGLYNNYSIETLFDELDVISRFDYVNGSYHYNEITKKQLELYKYMDVEPIIK